MSVLFPLSPGRPRKRRLPSWVALGAALFFPYGEARASGGESGTQVLPVLLALSVILVGAKVAGHFAGRVSQPAVLGELVFGILLGNLALTGWGGMAFIHTDSTVAVLAELGVVILLFEVGLESTVSDMLKVGASAFLVAVLGVIVPLILGWGVGALFLPQEGTYAHLFLGATLCATSVGITARVLRDLGRSQSPEARIILGAAVIDDVLGLVILAVVAGIIQAVDQGQALRLLDVGWIIGKAAGFLVGAVLAGSWLAPRLFRVAFPLRAPGVLLAVALAFGFLLAWISASIGLAPIVGAFAAGLILEGVHYREFVTRDEVELEDLVRPIAWLLVPVFFIRMGAGVDLRSFADPQVVGIALALTGAAVLGKGACAAGVLGGAARRLPVAVGMIPRGEVGLIFAGIGRSLTLNGQPVISTSLFSAVVVMVVVTTLISPPALKWALGRGVDAPEPT